MPQRSAGLLLFRYRDGRLQVLLVHPGGPFWAKKDLGAWSIPKGEIDDASDPLDVAKREFTEETGGVAKGEYLPLTPLKQSSGKLVFAWAVEQDFNVDSLQSNTFTLEWPPKSGKRQEFPEVDRAEWFDLPQARDKILKGQAGFLAELERKIAR